MRSAIFITILAFTGCKQAKEKSKITPQKKTDLIQISTSESSAIPVEQIQSIRYSKKNFLVIGLLHELDAATVENIKSYFNKQSNKSPENLSLTFKFPKKTISKVKLPKKIIYKSNVPIPKKLPKLPKQSTIPNAEFIQLKKIKDISTLNFESLSKRDSTVILAIPENQLGSQYFSIGSQPNLLKLSNSDKIVFEILGRNKGIIHLQVHDLKVSKETIEALIDEGSFVKGIDLSPAKKEKTNLVEKISEDGLFDDLEPGKQGGNASFRWEVVEQLGEGNFGGVFRVEVKNSETGLSHSFAVKSQRFSEEATNEVANLQRMNGTAHALDHYGSFKRAGDGNVFTFMEVADGSLSSALKKEGFYDSKVRLQMALAVETLHKRSLIHKDIKSDNFLMKDGEIILGDFGSAEPSYLTKSKKNSGTQKFAAPEVRNTGVQSSASDIYSLGATYLLQQINPKHRANLNILDQDVMKIMDLDLNDPLNSLIYRMVAKNPLERPSINQVVDALRDLESLGTRI